MTPASKTQSRVLNLLSLTVSSSYDDCAATLESAGLPRDAMPRGATWRAVAKMSDSELLAALGREQAEPRFNSCNVHELNY